MADDKERAKGWKRFDRNPVFDEATVKDMSQKGIRALKDQQLSDGGWGWFSGFGEHSGPHTTAVVVHGLQVARDNDVALPAGAASATELRTWLFLGSRLPGSSASRFASPRRRATGPTPPG